MLKGVERNFFSPLSQEQWNALPTMLEVTFQFEPRRGSTDRLGDTFLLKLSDVGVSVTNEDYPAIGVKTSFGFHQKFPYNAMPDDKGKCCTSPCQSTMYFLIPRPVKRFVLTYRKAAVAQGRVQRRRRRNPLPRAIVRPSLLPCDIDGLRGRAVWRTFRSTARESNRARVYETGDESRKAGLGLSPMKKTG